jgi:hypothetical protein
MKSFLKFSKTLIQNYYFFIKLSLQYTKVFATTCNSTGITFAKPLCRIRAVSRNVSWFSFGFELLKPLGEVFVI